MAIEVELKLAMDEAALRALPKLPLIQDHSLYKPITKRLLSTYFDTPDLTLQKRGIGIRLRRQGRSSLQTIKLEQASGGGLHQRHEWETPTPHDTLDFRAVDDAAVRKLLAKDDLQQALRGIFITDYRRTQRILQFDGDQIEFVIDRGAVRGNNREAVISEVELELKAGNAARLFEIAQALNEAVSLRLEPRSKAERGYRLLLGDAEHPHKATPPTVTADMSVSDAFARVVQSCIAHLQANERGVTGNANAGGDPGADDGTTDPEYLHQVRVALRRLRSAFAIFAAAIPRDASTVLRAELRWLSDALNDARNWDVFVTRTLHGALAVTTTDDAWQWLERNADARRHASNQLARAALGSRRYQALLLSLYAWVYQQGWRQHADAALADAPLVTFAADVLRRRDARLRKQGKHLRESTADERHAFRIAAKKLRYAAEFFAPLYAPKAVRTYLKPLAALQDVLGVMNDAATATTLLATVEVDAQSPAQHRVIGWMHGWVQAQQETHQLLHKRWRRCKLAPTFWPDRDA